MLGSRVPLRRRRRTFFIRCEAADVLESTPGEPNGFHFQEYDRRRFAVDPIFQIRHRADRFRKRDPTIHSCFGFVDGDGTAASYAWLTAPTESPASAPLGPGLFLTVPPGTAYIWDCATRPESRGSGLYTTILRTLAGLSLASGVRAVWICCDPDNAPSRRGILGAGFEEVFTADLYEIGPFRAARVKGRWSLRGAGAQLDLLDR